MRPLLLLAIIFNTSCGTMNECPLPIFNKTVKPEECTIEQLGNSSDVRLLPFLEQFVDDAHRYGSKCFPVKHIAFRDGPLPANINWVGYCTGEGDISLIESYWKDMDEGLRRTLVYHELGHCALHKTHARPGSYNIMNPMLLPSYIAEPNWDELVEMLFTKKG